VREGWEKGTVVGGHELLELLGAGGMGVVYRVRHVATGALRALKTLGWDADDMDVERLEREGQAMARLRHPHLLEVHAAGVQAGLPFLVLELAEGGSLSDRLREGPLPADEVVSLGLALAQALAVAHAAGVLHRDLKPDNVLFDGEGRPKLADFGLARLGDRTRLTETGTVMGTPKYMSPEQARGESSGPPSDVYSLGALLFHAASGRAPVEGGGGVLALLDRIQREVPPRLGELDPALPPALEQVVARCLAKDPQDRPTLAEFEVGLRGTVASAQAKWPVWAAGVGLIALGVLLSRVLPPAPRPEPVPTPSASSHAQPSASPSPHARAPAEFSAAKDAEAAAAAWLDSATLIPRHEEMRVARSASNLDLYEVASRELTSYAARYDLQVKGLRPLACFLVLAQRGHLFGKQALLSWFCERQHSLEAQAVDHGCFGVWAARTIKQDSDPLQRIANVWLRQCRPEASLKSIKADAKGLRRAKGPVDSLGAAWKYVWDRDHPLHNRVTWEAARERLVREAYGAVWGYLEVLRSSVLSAKDRHQVQVELMRAAELAWSSKARLRILGGGSVGPERPRQADEVLAVVSWARGHYLRALLRWPAGRELVNEQAAPPGAMEDLDRALVLQPDLRTALGLRARALSPEFPARAASDYALLAASEFSKHEWREPAWKRLQLLHRAYEGHPGQLKKLREALGWVRGDTNEGWADLRDEVRDLLDGR
jgi:hypothetical protein